LTKRLLATLGPVVGSDRIRATVNVEYQTDSSEENDEKYDPTVSVPLSMQRTEEGGGSGGPEGVPGTSSNVPAAKTKAVSAASGLGPVMKTESATYGVNKMTRHEVDPAGGIRRITAAIVLDDDVERQLQGGKWVTVRRKRPPEELRTIGELAQAAIGFNAARGDSVSVENLSFDRPNDSDLPSDTWMERLQKGLDDNSLTIRYAGLLVLFVGIYFVMIRPLQKRVLATPVRGPHGSLPAAAASEIPALPSSDVPAFSPAQRSLALKNEIAAFVRSEPETSTAAVRAWLRQEG